MPIGALIFPVTDILYNNIQYNSIARGRTVFPRVILLHNVQPLHAGAREHFGEPQYHCRESFVYSRTHHMLNSSNVVLVTECYLVAVNKQFSTFPWRGLVSTTEQSKVPVITVNWFVVIC